MERERFYMTDEHNTHIVNAHFVLAALPTSKTLNESFKKDMKSDTFFTNREFQYL